MKRYADYFGLLPLLAFIVAFLGLPLVAITRFSLQDSKGNFTLNNFSTITSGIYRDAFWLSFQLSVLSAAISLILGFVFALAVTRLPIPILKGLISTASGVFANTGGVPLAFMFVASLGTYGLLTDWLRKIGVDLYANSWTLYSFSGLLIVYLYFQVPLMILVSLPIIEGIKREWREAALTLGAPYSFFWRKVIAPIIAPQLLATFLLLFTNSFAAYATAAALTSGTLALVPVQIASLIASNVQVDGANTAMALGVGMVSIVAVAMTTYILLERRVVKWKN
ncbi:MAG: ABC transporter permease subunit [Actinobacteria bacterium]|jgi:putative spermidine/putrescine transport system permease protein|nr:ABC transporter permease subunit [Actinomycetota bacterium]NCV96079.1 ABC transporter permease subunit [Actinomycetota bacterium]NCW47142.1 ABC transporter permease subunit [Actinomycetota bacterium]NCW76095.1 ABC transporter permease subunit [Actinomycetota bacterium]NCW96999.1 ABC transporter permease subunit [Actinomycetota bacterium]